MIGKNVGKINGNNGGEILYTTTKNAFEKNCFQINPFIPSLFPDLKQAFGSIYNQHFWTKKIHIIYNFNFP